MRERLSEARGAGRGGRAVERRGEGETGPGNNYS